MATPVIMPRQGQSVESCIIGEWHKKKGDPVKVGDNLFTYETDKATFDEVAKVDGELIAVFFEEGDDVPCLLNVCVIGDAGEDWSTFIPEGATQDGKGGAATAPAAAAPAATETKASEAPAAAASAAVTAYPPSDATAVIMPRQGQSVESCIIGEWHIKKGDEVKVGDKLFTYETDKATFDEEAKVAGKVLAIFFGEGDDVPCLLNVCVIGAEGDGWEVYIPEGATQDGAGMSPAGKVAEAAATPTEPAATQSAAPAAAETTAAPAASPTEGLAGPISPRARKLAEKQHADLRFASPSGPNGRVIERDVQAVIAAGHLATSASGSDYAGSIEGTGLGGRVRVEDLSAAPASAAVSTAAPASAVAASVDEGPDFEDVKLPNIRKVIAKAMHTSISTMAQLTLNTSFDATDVIAFRARIKKAIDAGLDEKLGFNILKKVPTFNDIVLYAVTRTVLQFPDCNAHFLDDKMRYFKNVHLGVAVDTPRGLMVPVVRNANKMSISEISAEVKSLAAAAQSGSIGPDALKGSTITITNLGSMGIESFTPVINPPETCILGVDNLQTRVKEVNGELKAYKVMGLSLTIDHRAVDGAPAARFLQALVKNLENFSLLMMEH